MPFKVGKAPSDMTRKLDQILKQGLSKNVEAGLNAMYMVLSATADYYVPEDTTSLIMSRSFRIYPNGDGWRLTYGYYTDYAYYLHEYQNWQPKPPGTPGKPNGSYNPNAKPDWLNIAWRESGQDAVNAFGAIVGRK